MFHPRRALRPLFLALLLGVGAASASTTSDLLRMSEQLDQLDQADFQAALDSADRCRRVRDFACSDKQLRTARKFASNARAKASLAAAEAELVAEKKRADDEARALSRRERELEEAEERLKAQELAAQRDAERAESQADSGMSTAEGVALFGSLLNQSLAAQSAARAADNARARQFDQQRAQVAASVARDQQRFAREREDIARQRAEFDRQRAEAQSAARLRDQQQQDAARRQRERAEAQQVADKQRARTEADELAEKQQRERAREDALRRSPPPVASVAASGATKSAANADGAEAGTGKGVLTANTGRSAVACVTATREGNDIAFQNNCAGQIFVVWCGDLKYSKQRCGDGPAGNSYYTHSTNVDPGEKRYARGVGDYRFAACEGGIAFGKDEIRDQPDGTFVCVPRYRRG